MLKKSFTPNVDEAEVIGTIEATAVQVKSWMEGMRLKMNEEKTEFILCGSRSKLQQCITQNLNVNGVQIPRNDCIKYVGGYIDSQLNFKKHI